MDGLWHHYAVKVGAAGALLKLGTVLDIDGTYALEPLMRRVAANSAVSRPPACIAPPRASCRPPAEPLDLDLDLDQDAYCSSIP
eukprot:4206536-Prymnesium_polylepis.1